MTGELERVGDLYCSAVNDVMVNLMEFGWCRS